MWVRYAFLPLPFFELTLRQFNYGPLATIIGERLHTRNQITYR